VSKHVCTVTIIIVFNGTNHIHPEVVVSFPTSPLPGSIIVQPSDLIVSVSFRAEFALFKSLLEENVVEMVYVARPRNLL
jgi:hypothetical protein